jgi:branched-chain amino acid transport system substrate-binding protein
MAVKEIAIEHEVPLISCAAAEAIISPVNPWIFKTPQKDSDAVRCIYQHMQKHGISKVALLTGSTGFGTAGRDQLRAIAPEYGMEIVSDQTYGAQDTDMKPQLIQIQETDAQAVVNWSIVPAQSIVVQNADEMGLEIPIYQSHGFGNIKYAEAAGDAAEKVIFPAGRLLIAESLREEHAQRAPLLAYKQAYEEKFGEEVSTFGGHAYDSLHLVLNAIRAVGSDPADIRDYIESTQAFIGTGGIFWFSPEDHNGLDMKAFEMMTVRDGKFVSVED